MSLFSKFIDRFTKRDIEFLNKTIESLETNIDKNFEIYQNNLDLANKKYEDRTMEYRNACVKCGEILLRCPDMDKTDLSYSDLKTIWKNTDMIRYEFPIMAITEDKYTLNTSSLESSFVILNALDDLGFRCSIFENLLKISYELEIQDR